MPAFWAELVRALPDRLDRGRARRGRLGRVGAADERAGRPRPARRRRPLRHERRAAPRGDRARRRQLDPRQGEPDRDADRDDRGRPARPGERLHGGDVAPLGRDRGHDDRRPRRRARRPARSRRARRRAPTAWPSTTSCCGSRRSSATRVYPGWAAFPRGAIGDRTRRRSRACRARLQRCRRRSSWDWVPMLNQLSTRRSSARAYPGWAASRARRASLRDGRRSRRTKIVATIGPASSTPEVLASADEADRRRAAQLLARDARRPRREARRRSATLQEELGRPVALIADLQGPKLRIGELPEPVELERGEEVDARRRGRRRRRRPPGRAGRARARCCSPASTCSSTTAPSGCASSSVERGRARCEVLVGGDGQLAQGRQPARRAAADPVADAEGPRRPRVRARARRRLRGALVRPLGRRRPGAEDADRGLRRRPRT